MAARPFRAPARRLPAKRSIPASGEPALVAVVREELLQGKPAPRQLLPETRHLGRRQRRRVRLRRGHVRPEELELRHAADRGRDRQAPGVTQQRCRVGAAVDEQLVLGRDLHQDHAEVLPVGGGKRQFLEAASLDGVHGHLHAVEIVPLDGLGHDGAVGVARHADEPRDLLLAQFVEGLQRPVRRLDCREIGLVADAVQVEQVEVVGLQPLEAVLDLLEGGVARPRAGGDLGGEEHVLPPRRHDAADSRLALAVPVAEGGVEVVDAGLDRLIEHGGGLLCRVHQEAAAAAEGEDRDLHARAAEGPVRQLRGRHAAAGHGPDSRARRQRRHCRDGARRHRQAASLQKLTPAHPALRRHNRLRSVVSRDVVPGAEAPGLHSELRPRLQPRCVTPASRRPREGTRSSPSRTGGRRPPAPRSRGATSSPTPGSSSPGSRPWPEPSPAPSRAPRRHREGRIGDRPLRLRVLEMRVADPPAEFRVRVPRLLPAGHERVVRVPEQRELRGVDPRQDRREIVRMGKSPCDSMRTITSAAFACAAISWNPSTTRVITSSLGSPGAILSPNIRTYGTPRACARSMNRRPSSNCCARFTGSFSCMAAEAPRPTMVIPSAARSCFVAARRVPWNSGTSGRSISPATPQLDPAVPEAVCGLEDRLPAPGRAPERREGDPVARRHAPGPQDRGRAQAGAEGGEERAARGGRHGAIIGRSPAIRASLRPARDRAA